MLSIFDGQYTDPKNIELKDHYDVVELSEKTYIKKYSVEIATIGFKLCVLYPFNRNVFTVANG